MIRSSGSLSSRFAYTGCEFDSESGLYYYRARFYDPQFGRFVAEDPIGFEGGYNFYAYVLQNPMNTKDPYGLKIWVCSRKTKPPLTP